MCRLHKKKYTEYILTLLEQNIIIVKILNNYMLILNKINIWIDKICKGNLIKLYRTFKEVENRFCL